VLQDRVPLEKFIVSKSLRDDYKNADQIAHRVLADRMAQRDPGTAPKVGDRVQYVYVAENGNQSKQGDRIEHVDYVRANKLHYDATFYVDHQIQNPVAQLFALCIEQLNGYKRPAVSYDAVYQKSLSTIRTKQPDLTPAELEEEATLLVLKHKEKQIDSLMFLGSPELSAIVRKRGHSLIKGPMDRFMKKTEPSN